MKKDFSKWHSEEVLIDRKNHRVFFHEREIWFSHIGVNIGFEKDGKGENFGRPVIIFRKFNNNVFWGIPLTTRNKSGKFYLQIGTSNGHDRVAILSQLKLMDAKRLYQKIGIINETTHKILEERLISLCKGQ